MNPLVLSLIQRFSVFSDKNRYFYPKKHIKLDFLSLLGCGLNLLLNYARLTTKCHFTTSNLRFLNTPRTRFCCSLLMTVNSINYCQLMTDSIPVLIPKQKQKVRGRHFSCKPAILLRIFDQNYAFLFDFDLKLIKIFNQKRAHNLIFEQKLLIFERKQLIFKKILIVEYGCKVIVLSIRRKSHLSGNVTIPWYLKPDLKISCFLFVSKIAHRKPVQNDKPMSSFIKIFFVYFQNLKFSEILEILKIFSTRKF